ncbi:MAG: PP2C family protein-serine/threonine phosphatase [Flavobacteriales bacterium]|nr:PP2C family protein-serine/threonine phosphatase [Flavobacteriales bacterium]
MAEKSRSRNKRLQLKDFKVDALLEITHTINSNCTVDVLLDLYRRILEKDLGIEKLVLYAHQGKWHAILQFGVEGDPPDVEDTAAFQSTSGMTFGLARGGTESFDVVIPVTNDDIPIAYILVGDKEEDKVGTSPVIKHMKFIQTITNVVLVAIQNKRLAEENLRQARISKELELAAEMQSLLVPNSLPQDEHFDVSAVYKPHQQVGGDYYDFIELKDGRVMFCTADVSGKGVSAAFLMSNFQAYLMAIFKYMDLGLQEVVHNLNERVMSSAMGEKYITLFIGTFDRTTRKLNYINCGHNPPVLIHPNGQAEQLSLGSIGLGMFEEIPRIQEGQLTLDPGSMVICYTDGLVEQENSAQEEFGIERLTSLGREHINANAELVNVHILKSFNDFRGDEPFVDDTALLTCKFL